MATKNPPQGQAFEMLKLSFVITSSIFLLFSPYFEFFWVERFSHWIVGQFVFFIISFEPSFFFNLFFARNHNKHLLFVDKFILSKKIHLCNIISKKVCEFPTKANSLEQSATKSSTPYI